MTHSFSALRIYLAVALAVFFSLAVFVTSARAEIIASESFDYGTRTIRGCNGGEGWADAWTGDNLILQGSFPYPALDARGHRLITLGDSAGKSDSIKCSMRTPDTRGREHLLTNGKFGRTGTELWLGFLACLPDGPTIGSGKFAGISLLDDRRERVFLGKCSQKDMWGFERSAQLLSLSNVRGDTNVVFLVYKMSFRENHVQMEMWINPKPGTNDLSSEVISADTVSPFQFNRLRICSAPVSFGIDELRFGTTYADVAPPRKDN